MFFILCGEVGEQMSNANPRELQKPYFTLNYKENCGFPVFFPGVFF